MKFSNMAILLMLYLSGSAAADEKTNPTSTKTNKNQQDDKLAAKRLEFMKSSVKDYEFFEGPEFKEKFSLVPEPLLRFTNPVSGLQDGGFMVWKSASGRPMAGAQVFLTSDGLWLHEFQSVAPVPFRASRDGKIVWEPGRAGADQKPVPDAPVPAAKASQRLVQMRQMVRRFAVSDEFEGRENPDPLRLLPNPMLRFGAEDSDTLDGALFVYAHGTDPELLIVVEALKSDDAYRWHYSLAPMTAYAMKAMLDEKPIWEVAWRKPPFLAEDPFFILVHSREPSLKSFIDSFRQK